MKRPRCKNPKCNKPINASNKGGLCGDCLAPILSKMEIRAISTRRRRKCVEEMVSICLQNVAYAKRDLDKAKADLTIWKRFLAKM